MRQLPWIVLLAVPLAVAACGEERPPDAPRVAQRAPAVPAVDLLAAGHADDVETHRTELDEFDARHAALLDAAGGRPWELDEEARREVADLAADREEAALLLAELETRTGEEFTLLAEDLRIVVADLERNLDATARRLGVEVPAVERTASLAPAVEEAATADPPTDGRYTAGSPCPSCPSSTASSTSSESAGTG